LLGIADDQATPPFPGYSADVSEHGCPRCVDSDHILPKTPTICTREVRFRFFKQLILHKVSSCRFSARADDVGVEASPAGFVLNDL
jgi:hypothetical protein